MRVASGEAVGPRAKKAETSMEEIGESEGIFRSQELRKESCSQDALILQR